MFWIIAIVNKILVLPTFQAQNPLCSGLNFWHWTGLTKKARAKSWSCTLFSSKILDNVLWQKYMMVIMIDVIDNLMISSCCCWYRKCLRCYQSARWPIFLYLPHDLDGCLCIATLQIAPKENFIDDWSASSSWSLGQSQPTAGKA